MKVTDTRIIRPIRPTFSQLFAEGAGSALGKGLVDLPFSLATEGVKYALIDAPEQRKREAFTAAENLKRDQAAWNAGNAKFYQETLPEQAHEREQLDLDRQKALLGVATSRASTKAFLPERVGRETRPEIAIPETPQVVEPSPPISTEGEKPTRPFWEALRSEAASPEPSTDVSALAGMGKRFETAREENLPKESAPPQPRGMEGGGRISRRTEGEAAPAQMRSYTPETTPTEWQPNIEGLAPQAYIAPPKYARTAEGRDIVSATVVSPEDLFAVGLSPEQGQVSQMPLTYEPVAGTGNPLGWANLAWSKQREQANTELQIATALAAEAADLRDRDPAAAAAKQQQADALADRARKGLGLPPLKRVPTKPEEVPPTVVTPPKVTSPVEPEHHPGPKPAATDYRDGVAGMKDAQARYDEAFRNGDVEAQGEAEADYRDNQVKAGLKPTYPVQPKSQKKKGGRVALPPPE